MSCSAASTSTHTTPCTVPGVIASAGGTKNLILCRIVWEYLNYAPLDSVEKVKVPTLLIAGLQDDLTPAAGIQAAAERMTDAKYIPLDGTHISLYGNAGLVPAMVGFLKDRVPLRSGTVA